MPGYEQNTAPYERFESLNGWTRVSGGGAGAIDDLNTVPALATASRTGGPCVRLTLNTGGSHTRIQKSSKEVIDAQGAEPASAVSPIFCRGSFGFWVKTDNWADDGVTVSLLAWRDPFSGSGYYQTFIDLNTVNTVHTRYEDGWTFVVIAGSQMAASGGAPAWGEGQSIDRFYIGLEDSAAVADRTLLLGEFYANIEAPPIGARISFDGSNDTDLTIAAPYLQSLDMRATSYQIYSLIDSVDKLSAADLEELRDDYGWTIGCSGTTDLTTLSQVNRLADLNANKNGLISLGHSTWRHYSYPSGAFNKAVVDDLETLGFVTARTNTSSIRTPAIIAIRPNFMMLSGYGSATRTLATVMSDLDTKIKYGREFSLHTRRLTTPDSANTDPDVWKQMMQMISIYKTQGRIADVVASEYVDSLTLPGNTAPSAALIENLVSNVF